MKKRNPDPERPHYATNRISTARVSENLTKDSLAEKSEKSVGEEIRGMDLGENHRRLRAFK